MTRFDLESLAHRLPVPPPFLFDHLSTVVPSGDVPEVELPLEEQELEELQSNALGLPMLYPLSLAREGEEPWLIPQELMLSVSGAHVLVKRQVAKGKIRGSIKERWAQDDYIIRLEGTLIGAGGQYPREELRRLLSYFEAGTLIAYCPLLELFGVSRIVVESWELPHTSGTANQNFTAQAVSDDSYKLLLTRKTLAR